MPEKVTLRQMFLYALGWIGFSVFWPFNIARMPLYLNGVLEQAGIHDARVLGLLLAMTGIFGMSVPFIVGSLSDRIYTRIGRRRPVIFGALPIFAVSFIALIAAPSLWLKIVALAFLYLSFYCMQTPYQALMPEIVPSGQRGTMSGITNLISMICTVAYFGAGPTLWKLTSPAVKPAHAGIWSLLGSAVTGTARFFIGPMVTVLAIVVCFLAGAISLLFGVKEKTGPGENEPASLPFLEALRSSPDYLRYLVAVMLMWLGFNVVAPYFTLYATHVLRLSEQAASFVLGGMAVTAALGTIPAGIIGDRFGRKRAILISIPLLAAGLSFGYFIKTLQQGVVIMALGGFGYAFLLVLPYALSLDLMPAGRTGQFVGINNMVVAMSNTLGAVVGGFIAHSRMGYRGIFLFAGLSLMASVLVYAAIHEKPVQPVQSSAIERSQP